MSTSETVGLLQVRIHPDPDCGGWRVVSNGKLEADALLAVVPEQACLCVSLRGALGWVGRPLPVQLPV